MNEGIVAIGRFPVRVGANVSRDAHCHCARVGRTAAVLQKC